VRSPDGDALLARQPILDDRLDVVAYELLYRTPEGRGMPDGADPCAATASVLVDSLLGTGLDRISGGLPVHVNFPASMLDDIPTLVVPPGQLVVEVLEDTVATPRTVASLSALRSRGYRVALDDYVPGVADERLLECVDIVKLDLAYLSARDAVRVALDLRARNITCMAEKVETSDQFETCRAGGIRHFQGYFLQRPETYFGRRVPTNALAACRLLIELQEAEWAPRTIERLIGSDVGLAYRVLRAVQSAGLYLPRRIESLSQAIILLGRDQIVRIVALLLLSRLRDRPVELMRNALLRGRMCELLATRARIGNSGAFFMSGLLSLLPALLGTELPEIISTLPLSGEIQDGLAHGAGPIGQALRCVVALEQGRWNDVEFGDLSGGDISAAYREACAWLCESRSLLEEP
jgi:EAL and modified HD-GYP domain-containing signal transduction protein